MQATRNNVTNARDWLLHMGNSATKLGLTIQYCMPLPAHILQRSGEQCGAVSLARATRGGVESRSMHLIPRCLSRTSLIPSFCLLASSLGTARRLRP